MKKLMEFAKKFFDITFWKFILVGAANTLFGYGVAFVFYNLFGLGYWLSSASNYVLGSILSYFLNKYFTFQQKEKSVKIIVKFIINITICYIIAYGLAKPLITYMLSGYSEKFQDNAAMLVGMCLFVGLNYIGQRFFTFKSKSVEMDGK